MHPCVTTASVSPPLPAVGLSRCHVTMDNLTGIEVDQLEGVVDKYRHMLDDRGLDFELLANPGF